METLAEKVIRVCEVDANKVKSIVDGWMDSHSEETSYKDKAELGDAMYNRASNGGWGDRFAELIKDGDSEAQATLDRAVDQVWSKLKKSK